MKNLSEIYGPDFFREWGPSNTDYVRSAELVAGAIYEIFRPASLADLGCGCGVYSHVFTLMGARVLAIDGVIPPSAHSFPVEIITRDLAAPFKNTWGSFDLALCLEVAEHIPEEFTGTFLRNLAAFSDRLVMSAAPPGQGGRRHVNEQPRRYWARKLAAIGFAYNRRASGRLLKILERERPPFMWMANHIGVYERAKDRKQLEHGLPFAIKN
ncbi:MAG: class I SAM-dependent methyltransferase [Proteobacteria bacterium]|nr:class I SAM-dependent methyltransferase [Pseudomonadota bacterium]MBU2572982.1 class I SAM-dependent methyltransferase [Elusimicrobiota bacterium]